MNLDFEVVVFLPRLSTFARKYAKQPTNNEEQFCGQRNEEILSAKTSQNFALLFVKFLPSTGSISHFLSIASMSWNSFCFDKILVKM